MRVWNANGDRGPSGCVRMGASVWLLTDIPPQRLKPGGGSHWVLVTLWRVIYPRL